MSLEEALSEAEQYRAEIEAQRPGLFVLHPQAVGSDQDLTELEKFVNEDGRCRATKTTLHCFDVHSGDVTVVLLAAAAHSLRPIAQVLVAYLKSQKKVIEIDLKKKRFNLVNPSPETVERVLGVVERLEIKDEE